MIVFFSRKYEASSIGVRLVEVLCEKCGCSYLYKLARVGSGSATAPYAIGSKSAQKESSNQAHKELDRRLEKEAELVPCPRCSWVNRDLVEGYRRGRHEWMGKLATFIGVVGTFTSLLIALILFGGRQADRGPIPYFLWAGPAISLGLCGFLFFARNRLRGLIDPNARFPDPPKKLPVGTPPALVVNLTTGDLEEVRPKPRGFPLADEWADFEEGQSGPPVPTWVHFQLGRSSLPPACAGCLSIPDQKSADRRSVGPAIEFAIPRCASCAGRQKWTVRKLGLLGFGLAMAVLLPILHVNRADEVVAWVCVAGLGSVAALFGIWVGNIVSRSARIEMVDSSRGILRLKFRNQDYRKLIRLTGGLA